MFPRRGYQFLLCRRLWKVIFVLFMLVYQPIHGKDWFKYDYKEQEWYINTSALTVSSITYNPSSKYSDWVSRLFGEQAIFHNRSFSKRAGAYLLPEEKFDRSRIFKEHFQLPPEAILPSCSFEIMGFALVDFDHPISHYYMHTAPSVGVGKLSFQFPSDSSSEPPIDTWKCYYRAMYEFTAKKLLLLPVVHWPIFIYCPAPKHDYSCLNVHDWYKRSLIAKVMEKNIPHDEASKKLSSQELAAKLQFSDRSFDGFRHYKHLIQSSIGELLLPAQLDLFLMHGTWTNQLQLDMMNIVRKPKSNSRAICAVIPYTATDSVRKDINDGMAYDFIRYYNRLGFKVVIYDRDGVNYDHIMHGAYSQIQGDDSSQFDLLYYNFTVLQRLIPGISKFEAENVDSIKLSKVVVRGDIDKRLTYTYCRTHLRQTFGIEEVLVIDYDEFLYCPRAPPTIIGQKQYLDEYFTQIRNQGVEQLFLKQRVLVSGASSKNMTECLISQVNQAASLFADQKRKQNAGLALSTISRETDRNRVIPSIFHCLSPFQFGVKMFFDKALHMGHACPYTSFHFSAYLRFVDCYVNSFQSASRVKRQYDQGGCSLIHITSRPNHYNRSHIFDLREVEGKSNEIYAMLQEPIPISITQDISKIHNIDNCIEYNMHNCKNNHVEGSLLMRKQQQKIARSLLRDVAAP